MKILSYEERNYKLLNLLLNKDNIKLILPNGIRIFLNDKNLIYYMLRRLFSSK